MYPRSFLCEEAKIKQPLKKKICEIGEEAIWESRFTSFFINFHEVYEYFRKIFLFLSHILIFHLKIFFLWIFIKLMSIFGRFFFCLVIFIDFFFKQFFFMNVHEVWVFLKDFFWVIYWFYISYSMAQRTSTEVLRIIRPRTERVNYLDYLDCLKVMNLLVNVCIFPLSKKRQLTPQTWAFLLFSSSSWFFS